MNSNDLDTEARVAEAFGQAVTAFAAPGGLKESLRKKLLVPAAAGRHTVLPRCPRWLAGAVAAAVLAAAGLVALLSLSGGASLALADVQAATDKVTWVHVKFQGGGQIAEQWICPGQGKWFAKLTDGDIVFVDETQNVRLRYEKSIVTLSQDAPTIYADGNVPKWQPKSAWQFVVGPYEAQAGKAAGNFKVDKTEETIDGRRLVRFDMYYKDALGRQRLETQMWADPETRLPVRGRYRLQIGERTQPGQEWTTGTFDFPATGPADIYALGVPAGLQPLRSDSIPDDAKAVIEKARKAAEAFPKTYRLVTWTNDRDSEIDVVWRDGEKLRMNRYFNLRAEYPAYHLSLPASAEQVLKWTETQTPMDITVFADGREYRRLNPYPKGVRTTSPQETTVHVSRISSGRYPRTDRTPPTDYQWPFLNRGGPAEVVKDDPETPADCILLRFGATGFRHEYYVDPSKGYMCMKEVHWRLRAGRLEKWRDYWLFNLERASDTAWYATRRLMIDYGDSGAGIGRSHAYWNVRFTPLKAEELPPGIFDGKKLLEGAKVEAD